ncbi:DUF6541 family protein [Kocuria sp. M1N1S27]|uniref:DUF6541 family protein n=1 Tax=Kocuria kalidii TaxID=3376283 RepID=UPI0037AB9E9E
MSDWMPHVPALVLVVVLLWAPGLALQLVLRDVRPLFPLAAPAYGLAVIGTAGIVLDLLDVGFSLLTLGVLTLALWALAGVVGLLARRARGPAGGTRPGTAAAAADRTGMFGLPPVTVYRGAVVLGLLLGAALLVRRLLFVVQEPGRFAQRYDNVFHLNAVRYVVDTASASSLTLGRMVDPDKAVAIYPAVWHGLAGLAYPLAEQSPMVAGNVVLFVVAALVWPASCLFLTRTLVGPSPVALVVAGVASAGFAVLPFSVLEFGPLLPNLLGLSVAPVALAHLATLLGLDAGSRAGRARRPPARLVHLGLCCLVVTGGAMLAHPNVGTLLLVLLVPMVLTAWWGALRRAVASRQGGRTALVVLLLPLSAAAWTYLWDSLGNDFIRFAHTTPAAAYGEALLYATNGRQDVPWFLVLLTVLGVGATLARRELRWLGVAQLLVVSLYVVAASAPTGPWREWAVGSWYQDSFRLAASLPVVAVPLIALGATALADLLRRGAEAAVAPERRTLRVRRLVAGGTAVLLVAASVPLTQVRTMRDTLLDTRARFSWDTPDGILTEDERDLLERLPRLTDEDDLILVNPWNGGSLAYAVAGSRVTQYHIGGPERARMPEVVAGLTADEPARACRTARSEGIDFVLDFGRQYLEPDPPGARPYVPIDTLGETPEASFDLVASEGDAELWEVTAC